MNPVSTALLTAPALWEQHRAGEWRLLAQLIKKQQTRDEYLDSGGSRLCSKFTKGNGLCSHLGKPTRPITDPAYCKFDKREAPETFSTIVGIQTRGSVP